MGFTAEPCRAQTVRLEAVGVLGAPDGSDQDARLIERRHDQLAAISRLQEIVERKIRQSQEQA